MKRISILAVFLFLFLSSATQAQIITTFAGTGTAGWAGDGGAATAAQLNLPCSIIVDNIGNVFFADRGNNRVRMIDTSGIIHEIAGNGTGAFGGDGGPASAAMLHDPCGLAIDDSGNLYIADYSNQVIRKVSPAVGGVITTFAGTPLSAGYYGDGGPANLARFNNPFGMSFDSHGNLYVADQYNHAVRKITPSPHLISTFAGVGTIGFSGDGGPANACTLYYPDEVFVDNHDNVFIADVSNHRVRKVNTAGIINTVAGSGTAGFSGDGGSALAADLYFPGGLKVDSIGNLYFEVIDNHIRWVDTSGIIHTICGDGFPGYYGDGGPAVAAEINQAPDIALDHHGNILIADEGNHRIRIFRAPTGTLGNATMRREEPQLYPNPVTDNLIITHAGGMQLTLCDIVGRVVYNEMIHSDQYTIDTKGLMPGIYVATVTDATGSKRTIRIVKE